MNSCQTAEFAEGAESHSETLRNARGRNFTDLGISLDLIALVDDKTAATRDRKAPTVGVYFGLTRYSCASPALKDAAMGQQSAVKGMHGAQAHSSLGGLR